MSCSNPKCQDGQYYEFWANHVQRDVLMDWMHCEYCHPDSDTDSLVPDGCWTSISSHEFHALLKKGYYDITG